MLQIRDDISANFYRYPIFVFSRYFIKFFGLKVLYVSRARYMNFFFVCPMAPCIASILKIIVKYNHITFLSIAQREDNRFGSVRLFICVFVRAHPAEPFDLDLWHGDRPIKMAREKN